MEQPLPESGESAIGEPAAAADTDDSIYFPSGGTSVDESGKALLRRHAARLKANPKLVVTLIGLTDPQGSRSYNLALAEERMGSVFEVLRSFGVPKGQIRRSNSGRGEDAAQCRTAVCRRQMRKVELIYAEE